MAWNKGNSNMNACSANDSVVKLVTTFTVKRVDVYCKSETMVAKAAAVTRWNCSPSVGAISGRVIAARLPAASAALQQKINARNGW